MNESNYYDEYLENEEKDLEKKTEQPSDDIEKEMTLKEKKEQLKATLETLNTLSFIGEDISEAMRGVAESYRDILPEMIESGELDEYPAEFVKMLETKKIIQKPLEKKSNPREALEESEAEASVEDVEIAYEEGSMPDRGQEGKAAFDGSDIRTAIGGISPDKAIDRLDEIQKMLDEMEQGLESNER